jgi:anti-anti-sigma factor
MGVKIKLTHYNDIPVFELHGRISGGDAIKLSKKLEAFVNKSHRQVILDLSRIDFVDSNWLGVFIYCLRLYMDNDKEIIFYMTSQFLKDIFRNANIHTIARIVDSLDVL